ncbi:MAG: serine protease [Acidimicrobiales bacterium]|nr:serine protease [Acidimicrobiales bacterium]
MAKRSCSLLLVLALCAAAGGLGARPATALSRTLVPGSEPAWATGRNHRTPVPPAQRLRLRVYLNLRDRAGAEAAARAVSEPGRATYRHYLSPAAVLARFAPTTSAVDAVRGWLQRNAVQAGYVPPNRQFVEATGTAAAVERAFGVHLGLYAVQGRQLRAADRPLSVPAELAPAISGVIGVDQALELMHPLSIGPDPDRAPRPQGGSHAGGRVVPPAGGYRNGVPCADFYGEQVDPLSPPFGGYPRPLPLAPCGYTPPQLRAAYGLAKGTAIGFDGRGTKVAIIDAFASPTVFADARTYAKRHDPAHPLRAAQFSQVLFPPNPSLEGPGGCDAAGWYGEETLDVEAVHAVAPGAGIVYVGGSDCQDLSLDKALNEVVSRRLAQIISNSYGNVGEDLPAAEVQAFQDISIQAALSGIGVYFASGDNGDEAARFGGKPTPDFAAASPWVTAVGGTSLGIDRGGRPAIETGWETNRSTLGAITWAPAPPGAFLYGSGGGTSRNFAQPFYQRGVVPDALARKNQTGEARGRVVPDVSVVGDPNTGMRIGVTQTFPEGVHYDEHRIGGTSLSSPVFAGIMALSDQVAHVHHGFVNPTLYSSKGRSGITDVTHVDGAVIRKDFANGLDDRAGIVTSIRTFDAPGLTIKTLPGYDDVTGLGRPDGLRFLLLA